MKELTELRISLREQRIQRRQTQADIAAAVGCSRKRVSEFELGQSDPGFAFVMAFAHAVGVAIRFDEIVV